MSRLAAGPALEVAHYGAAGTLEHQPGQEKVADEDSQQGGHHSGGGRLPHALCTARSGQAPVSTDDSNQNAEEKCFSPENSPDPRWKENSELTLKTPE